jgi:hypothetical protein
VLAALAERCTAGGSAAPVPSGEPIPEHASLHAPD